VRRIIMAVSCFGPAVAMTALAKMSAPLPAVLCILAALSTLAVSSAGYHAYVQVDNTSHHSNTSKKNNNTSRKNHNNSDMTSEGGETEVTPSGATEDRNNGLSALFQIKSRI
jgi:hypothetical protein